MTFLQLFLWPLRLFSTIYWKLSPNRGLPQFSTTRLYLIRRFCTSSSFFTLLVYFRFLIGPLDHFQDL